MSLLWAWRDFPSRTNARDHVSRLWQAFRKSKNITCKFLGSSQFCWSKARLAIRSIFKKFPNSSHFKNYFFSQNSILNLWGILLQKIVFFDIDGKIICVKYQPQSKETFLFNDDFMCHYLEKNTKFIISFLSLFALHNLELQSFTFPTEFCITKISCCQ